MEEKILIKSKSSKAVKMFFIGVILSWIIVAILSFVPNFEYYLNFYLKYGGYSAKYYILNTFVALAIIPCFIYLIYFLLSRCNITVTDKNIYGRTFWGKKVILPIHMVSAYSTSNIFSVLSITTSSGFIKFPCIGNYKEIANVLHQLLNERQLKTETQNSLATNESSSNSLDDLMKLKNLLDNGIITQEEFDTKKKELLGL